MEEKDLTQVHAVKWPSVPLEINTLQLMPVNIERKESQPKCSIFVRDRPARKRTECKFTSKVQGHQYKHSTVVGWVLGAFIKQVFITSGSHYRPKHAPGRQHDIQLKMLGGKGALWTMVWVVWGGWVGKGRCGEEMWLLVVDGGGDR